MTTTDGRGGIDAALVERLVAAQFPQWAGLPVRPVEVDGWDSRTYRLGEDLTVRLPSHPAYAAAVAKEQEWLPRLAPYLPVPVPVPVGRGRPGCGYPHPWTVNRWLPGTTAVRAGLGDLDAFAADLAAFLVALRAVDAAGGPPAGDHSFHRGGDLAVYDAETRICLTRLGDRPWATVALEVWEAALDSRWTAAPVWVHGDVATGNLLVRDGHLSAVIDFGTSAVGDPACDLVIAWTFLPDHAREAFRAGVDLDDGTWARARGWALWKALPSPAAKSATAAAMRSCSRKDACQSATSRPWSASASSRTCPVPRNPGCHRGSAVPPTTRLSVG